MDKPIYEIPVTPPDGPQGEWVPKRLIPPTYSPSPASTTSPTSPVAADFDPVPAHPQAPAGGSADSDADDGQTTFESLLAELGRSSDDDVATVSVEPPALPAAEPLRRRQARFESLVFGSEGVGTAEAPPALTPDDDSAALVYPREAADTTPIYSLDDVATAPVYPRDSAETTPIHSLDAGVPPTRFQIAVDAPAAERPLPVSPHVARAEARMSDDERVALAQADPELIRALEAVVREGASDLHVTAGAPPSLRVDGGLRPIEGEGRWMPDQVTNALYSLLTDDQRERFERELELDFAYTAGGARFRVNYYQQRSSIGGAFRLIPQEIKQLKDLGVPESIAKFAQLPRGLVLVTGPTGSGKSTTLAALIDLANRTRADHIVTVEDPIEFLHRHQQSLVNQREVGHDTHSFAAALKHVLRQDPDIILIGELRDLETISVALTAAETGHLVFATLHTQDAAQTIDRVIDVFPPHQQGQVRAQLAATLQGVVCQTLVKRASGRGRVVATEVLITTPAIGNLIREGKTYQITSMMQAGRDLGMHTMDQHLADLVNAGQITRQAAVDKAHEPESLAQLIQRVQSPTEASARAIAASEIDFGDTYSGRTR